MSRFLVVVVTLAALATASSDAVEDLASEGSCAEKARTCRFEHHTHLAQHAATRVMTQQCLGETASKRTKLQSMIAQNKDIMEEIEHSEASIHGLANQATKEEAEDVSMEDLFADEGESSMDKELMESNTDYSPNALKDALQKAEAVLSYNSIQSDRLFKKADEMASNPENLSKPRMAIVKKAAAAAAKAASARFVAEVEVTKLKAAVKNAEKDMGESKGKSVLDKAPTSKH